MTISAASGDTNGQPSSQQMSPQAAIEQARNLMLQRHYQEAANICQQIDAQLPGYVPASLLMSDIHLATGNLKNAMRFAERAIEADPQGVLPLFQRVKVWMHQSNWTAIADAMDSLCTQAPDNAIFQVVRADALMHTGKMTEALAAYDHAKSLDDLPLADENKAQCFIAMQRYADAQRVLEALLARDPKNGRAHYMMAKALIQLDRAEEAEEYCKKATQLAPNLSDAWKYMAVFATRKDDMETAVLHAYRAIKTDPANIHAYLLLTKALNTLKRFGESERVLREALTRAPGHMTLEAELRNLLIQTGQTNEAIQYLEKALANDPNNAAMKHLLAAMRGNATETAPSDYVAKLFDQYADNFDDHLQENLEYRTPSHLASAVREVLVKQNKPTNGLSLLDLGCGTGLAAEALKPHLALAVGVDLSPKMIDKAKQKNLYQETAVADIVSFMNNEARQFDLVACADVFVYVGQLKPSFTAARKVLKPGGLFLFSVEDGDDKPPFTLRKTARYAHSQAYIEALADEHGFTVAHYAHKKLRQDRGEAIMGHLYVLQAKAS